MESREPGPDRHGTRDELIRFGPAGWAYPDSPGHVYPADVPRSFDPLDYLADFFDTIEINASFYAPQPPRNYASWAKRVKKNPRFKFTAKLWQKFTHGVAEYGRHDELAYADAAANRLKAQSSKLKKAWTDKDVREVVAGYKILCDEGRLGAILAKFPYSFQPSSFSLELLSHLAEDFSGWPVVVELRHGAWGTREHALRLKQLGLGFCNIDQPIVGDSLGPSAGVTSDVGYVRLHGRRYDKWFEERATVAERYDYLYSAEELEPWVKRVERIAQAEGVREIYVVANNHFEGKGPANALMMRSMLSHRKVAAPPVLFATYRNVLQAWCIAGG